MTAQVPDTLHFQGREYSVLQWQGSTDCIPASEALGFTTVSPSTANWSGRIDHYGVWGDELYLFKVEASLENPADTPTPPHARREVLLRYEQLVDFEGRPTTQREYRYDFFVYENLKLPFTGSIVVVREEDDWDRPQAAPDEEPGVPLVIEFHAGRVVDFYDLED